MSSIAFGERTVWREALDVAYSGLRTYRWHHAGIATFVGALIALVNLPVILEGAGKYGWHTGVFLAYTLAPVFAANVAMVCWLIVDAGPDRARLPRLALAALASSVIAAAAVLAFWVAVDGPAYMAQLLAQRGKSPVPLPLMYATDLMITLIYSGLFFTVLELIRRRERTQHEFREVIRRQSAVAQQVLESRLTAMQAQVEPRFLFDSLVDIEQLYRMDSQAAASVLDRLIVFLRAALPKLRGEGSTLASEFELVQAYLSVVSSLHDGRPELTLTVADNCAAERFYPMLLLPLVQRAVRGGVPPASIRIGASRAGRDVAVVIRIATPGGCADDPEFERVRERLAGLFGKAATLDCAEIAQQATQLTLRFPASLSVAAAQPATLAL